MKIYYFEGKKEYEPTPDMQKVRLSREKILSKHSSYTDFCEKQDWSRQRLNHYFRDGLTLRTAKKLNILEYLED